MRLYLFLRAIARVIIRVLFRFCVYGSENIPREGGCLFTPNHMSFWDPLFLACAAWERPLTFMARTSLFSKPVLGFCLKKVGAVPVNRDDNDFSALRTALSLLKAGNAIGIYPQGTRCPDVHPSETDFQGGAVYMASVTGAPLIPIGVATKNYRVRWFRRTCVVIGEPIYLARQKDRAVLDGYTLQMKKAICAACDEATRHLLEGRRH